MKKSTTVAIPRDDVAIAAHRLTRLFGRRRGLDGELRAVDGVDLEIRRSEIFGLVGPDGAGKTTALRLLAAVMDPTSGRASVVGFDTLRQGEQVKRRIGYMAQQFSTRVGLMFHGRLIECDAPERIRARTPGELLSLRPDDLQGAARAVSAVQGVLEIQVYCDHLQAFVDAADQTQSRVVGALSDAGIRYGDLRRAQPRMEEAFISLIRSSAA